MTCDRFRATVVESNESAAERTGGVGMAAHADSCADCRAWLERYTAGEAAWRDEAGFDLTAAVAARTTGSACDRARVLLASAADEILDAADSALLRGHVGGCSDCRRFESALRSALATLPTLAELDPGPVFVAEVLARTSRSPASSSWADRARAAWQGVVRRPRFAWEAAYVCTLCWLLVFGHPVAALDWTTATVSAAARSAVPVKIQAAKVRVTSLRDQVVGDVARAAEGIVEAGRVSAKDAARTWQERAARWAMDEVSAFADDLSSSWNSLVAWFGELFAELRPEPLAQPSTTTEPLPRQARYSK